jgi:hypothetical protein
MSFSYISPDRSDPHDISFFLESLSAHQGNDDQGDDDDTTNPTDTFSVEVDMSVANEYVATFGAAKQLVLRASTSFLMDITLSAVLIVYMEDAVITNRRHLADTATSTTSVRLLLAMTFPVSRNPDTTVGDITTMFAGGSLQALMAQNGYSASLVLHDVQVDAGAGADNSGGGSGSGSGSGSSGGGNGGGGGGGDDEDDTLLLIGAAKKAGSNTVAVGAGIGAGLFGGVAVATIYYQKRLRSIARRAFNSVSPTPQ